MTQIIMEGAASLDNRPNYSYPVSCDEDEVVGLVDTFCKDNEEARKYIDGLSANERAELMDEVADFIDGCRGVYE